MNHKQKAGDGQRAAGTEAAGRLAWLRRLGPGWRLALVFIVYLGVRWFVFWGMEPVPFSDSASYIEQYRHGFGEGFFGRVRTWGYPLVFWLFGFKTGLVVAAQRLAGALAWFGLAVAAAGLFCSAAARRLAFWGTLVFSLALVVVIWDVMLLSESFANSFFIALTAVWICFLGARGAGLRPLGLLAALAVPFAGLRDSNLFLLYLLAGCAGLVLALCFFRGPAPRPSRRAFAAGLGLAGLIVLVCLVHTWDMRACRRNWQSVGGVLSMRIFMNSGGERGGMITNIPDNENIDWLTRHYGLPAAEARQRVGKTVYQPPPLSPAYERWLKDTGPRALLGFLAGHPGWVVRTFSSYPLYGLNHWQLYMQPPQAWRQAHLGLPRAIQRAIHVTLNLPLSIMWFNAVLAAGAAALGLGWLARAWRHGQDHQARRLAVLFWLIAGSAMMAFIAMFGDFYEPWRHAITGLVAIYAAAPLGLAWAAEFLFMRKPEAPQAATAKPAAQNRRTRRGRTR